MRVLLVDDEAIDLEWLRRRVAGSGLPLSYVGTANSGFRALEMMQEQQIDIILSDIRMPIMSGIEFVRKAKEGNPKVHVAFISGHEDFHYAKEALQLGASGYLLKPVDNAELYAMLQSLCDKVRQEQEQNRTMEEALSLVQQELLLRWFQHSLQAETLEQHIREYLTPLLQQGSAAVIVEMDDVDWKLAEEQRRPVMTRLSETISQLAESSGAWLLAAEQGARFVLLSASPQDKLEEQLGRLIAKVQEELPVTITVGVGQLANDMAELQESYHQADAALGAKWLLGKSRLLRNGSSAETQETLPPNLEAVVSKMLTAILDYDLVTVDDCLVALFSRNGAITSKNELYDLIIRITSKLHADLLRHNENLYELLRWESRQPAMLFQYETMDDILSWLRRRFFELSELIYTKRAKQKRRLVEEIGSYIDSNLEHKITLKEVAAHFDFTPNYLGTLFKEETGTLFSDYLTEKRMQRVCQLLADPTLKVYEIAERVGYKNILYFNRQFKQSIGMTPGEYRKKHKI